VLDKNDKKVSLMSKLEMAKEDVKKQLKSKYRERLYQGMPFAVLPRRIQTFKENGLGEFSQHPQFANHWYVLL
jgi:hypothetical protein